MDQEIYPYDTAAVSELLKHKRRTRGIKSCFPCRHRKVRCDGHQPCSSCVKRGHVNLCRAPSSSTHRAEMPSTSTTGGPLRRDEAPRTDELQTQSEEGLIGSAEPTTMISQLEEIERKISGLKKEIQKMHAASSSPLGVASTPASPRLRNKSPGRHVVEDATGATIFLGGNSDTPLALGCREAFTSGDSMVHEAIINQLVPRAYPFTSLWGPEASVKDVYETLPDESDIMRYWQAYQSTAYPFYPVLVDIDRFGLSLYEFLNQQASTEDRAQIDPQNEPSLSWLALLFAVLACGAQFTHDPVKERDLRSRVFICSSFQCLRMSNFFNNTNMDQVQTMALIGHSLRNNLDTNSAWILMGTTIRLAQSIGLHQTSTSLPLEEQADRGRLWWTLVWQDTFLSFTYDRPTTCLTTANCPIPLATASGLSFQECIFRICQIIIEQNELSTASDCRTQLEGLWDTAAPFLTSKSYCKSLQDHLERLALGIHLNYAICRVSLPQYGATPDPSNPVVVDCLRRARLVVEHFLELHRFSKTTCRSWAFVHNAVSCAITMHNLSYVEVDSLSDSNALAQRLLGVLENEARDSEWYDADINIRYFGPYSRAAKALKEIYGDNN